MPDHKLRRLAAKTESRFASFGFLDEAHAEFPKNVEHYNCNVPHRNTSEPYSARKPLSAETAALPKTVWQYRVIHRTLAEVITRATQLVSIIDNTEKYRNMSLFPTISEHFDVYNSQKSSIKLHGSCVFSCNSCNNALMPKHSVA